MFRTFRFPPSNLHIGLCACIGICLCIWTLAMPPAAQADPQWQLTGQSPDGQAQQYVDLNSLQGSGSRWTVHSYFSQQQPSDNKVTGDRVTGDRVAGDQLRQIRVDYVTRYDCDRQRYQDLSADVNRPETWKKVEGDRWGDASADPLNQATLDYICQHRPQP